MKLKAFLVALVASACCLTAAARDNYTNDTSVLPTEAKTTLTKHFPKTAVSHIKVDKNMFGVEGYDVVLNDGTEVDFDAKGRLKEVDCNRDGRVPDALMMKSIRDYVAKNYAGQRIVKYDVKRRGYEVELSSGVELEFNQQGAFTRIDR